LKLALDVELLGMAGPLGVLRDTVTPGVLAELAVIEPLGEIELLDVLNDGSLPETLGDRLADILDVLDVLTPLSEDREVKLIETDLLVVDEVDMMLPGVVADTVMIGVPVIGELAINVDESTEVANVVDKLVIVVVDTSVVIEPDVSRLKL